MSCFNAIHLKLLKSGRLLAILAALLWTLAPPARGAVYVAMSDADLVEGSVLVVRGQVEDISPWGDGGRPATRYNLSIDEVLKGIWSAPAIEVDLPGGRGRDGVLWRVSGTPQWQVGDEVLAFLAPTATGGWTLQQFFLGAFSVVEHGGQRMAIRDLSAGHALRMPGTTPPPDGARDLASFEGWLRDIALGLVRQADYFVHEGSLSETAKNAPIKLSTLLSPSEPWPLGCGNNGGNSLRWFDFDAGGAVHWRTHFSGQPGVPGRGLQAFQEALQAWSEPTGTFVDLQYDGITDSTSGLRQSDGSNTLLFDDPNDEIGGQWQGSGVLALGGPWISCALVQHNGNWFHRVHEADIVTQDGLEEFFEGLSGPSSTAAELFGHELGHTMGLDHSDSSEALMYSHLHNDGRGASLSSQDLSALLYLYGIREEPLPERPKALQAEIRSNLRIHLQWLDFSSDESGFQIERRILGRPYQVIATSPADSTQWVDTTAQPETIYHYRVRAHNAGGASGTTNRVIVETPAGNAPRPPSLMRGAPLDEDLVRLTWQDNAENETAQVLEILFPGEDTWRRAPFNIIGNATGLNLYGLESAQSYGFRLRARNEFGISEPSNAARVITLSTDTLCRGEDEALCLLAGRFRVEAEFTDPTTGERRRAQSIPSTDHTGFFWFFQPGNFELVVKMVDGRVINDSFWVYYGGITDLPFELRITDTQTGVQKSYAQAAASNCGQADTFAFTYRDQPSVWDGVPKQRLDRPFDAETAWEHLSVETLTGAALESAALPHRAWPHNDKTSTDGEAHPLVRCSPNDTTLCLLDGRISVTADYRNPHQRNSAGYGKAIQGTSQSGQFWFFDLDVTELVVKALDGSEVNGNLWLFFGSLTDVSYSLRVTDHLTGKSRAYRNSQDALCGGTDLEAFQGILASPQP